MNNVAPFTIDDFEVSDEIYFEASEAVPNYDLYWTVIGFVNERLHIKINKNGHSDIRFILPDLVIYRLPRPVK